jgi:hypothetical protein
MPEEGRLNEEVKSPPRAHSEFCMFATCHKLLRPSKNRKNLFYCNNKCRRLAWRAHHPSRQRQPGMHDALYV